MKRAVAYVEQFGISGLPFAHHPPFIPTMVSVRYLYGGEAEYLSEGAIRWGTDPAILQPHRSRTDIVIVYIGVAFGRRRS